MTSPRPLLPSFSAAVTGGGTSFFSSGCSSAAGASSCAGASSSASAVAVPPPLAAASTSALTIRPPGPLPSSSAELDAHLARHPLRDRRGLDAAVAVARRCPRTPAPRRARAPGSRRACRCRRTPPRPRPPRRRAPPARPRRPTPRLLARRSCSASAGAPPRPAAPRRLLAVVGAAALGAVAELRDRLADRERVPLLGDDAEHAVGVGLVGHVGLVGLDLDELLAALDLVPVGLQPLEDRALLHGVGQAGHRDVGHARQRTRKRARCRLSATERASRSGARARSAASASAALARRDVAADRHHADHARALVAHRDGLHGEARAAAAADPLELRALAVERRAQQRVQLLAVVHRRAERLAHGLALEDRAPLRRSSRSRRR